jgi:cation diffusion facilitator family transporter
MELAKGGAVAAKSFAILVLVGIVEVVVGIFSASVALIADGAHSFSDAAVSLIIWVGLRLSRKAPDGKFHFGYYRVETFSSIVAAIFMSILGVVILYESYQVLLSTRQIVNAEIAMIVALVAVSIALVMSVYKRREAKRFDSLALKTDAFNSVKDFLTSITAFFGVALSHYSGIIQTDSIAGIIIAFFIFTVSYYIIKEASLVLMDACSCTEIVSDIENIAKNITHVRRVHSIRLRKLGPYVVGDMHVEVDGKMTVKEAHKITTQIEEKVKQEFDEVAEIKVRIEPVKTQQKHNESP